MACRSQTEGRARAKAAASTIVVLLDAVYEEASAMLGCIFVKIVQLFHLRPVVHLFHLWLVIHLFRLWCVIHLFHLWPVVAA